MKYKCKCKTCKASFTVSNIKTKYYPRPHTCILCGSELIDYKEVKGTVNSEGDYKEERIGKTISA